MAEYRVQLDAYSGPMDLLLYLIRRNEVDIYDIPVARICDQYLGFVRLLQEIDPEAVGEFLVLAATLIEIKSRLLLPKPPPEPGDDGLLDPRADLVRQLLAYRTFREAAVKLGDRAELHAQRFGRPAVSLPSGEQEVDLDDVRLWDLVAALNRLMAQVGRSQATHKVEYDDTPITLHADDMLDRLVREGAVMSFERIFEGRTRSEMVGLFLALLELIRQHRVRVSQDRQFDTITVHLIDATPITTILEAAAAPGDGQAEPTQEAEDAVAEEAPYEEVEDSAVREAVFEDEPADDDDEFSRRIQAIEIADVDLGKKPIDDHAVELPAAEADGPADPPAGGNP